MSNIVEWSEFANQQGSRRDGIRTLKLVSGQSFNVRFVGNPLKFYKYFVNNRSAICEDPEKCSVRAKYNIDPGTRFAVNVIDRDEKNPADRLKLLEVPPSVLKPVYAWFKARKVDPGGKGGCDFNIDVTGQKKNTRYTVTPMDVTPFTEEEKEYIKANIYDLAKLHKPIPDNEIEDRLFGKREEKGGSPSPRNDAHDDIELPQPTASAAKSASGVDLPF